MRGKEDLSHGLLWPTKGNMLFTLSKLTVQVADRMGPTTLAYMSIGGSIIVTIFLLTGGSIIVIIFKYGRLVIYIFVHREQYSG